MNKERGGTVLHKVRRIELQLHPFPKVAKLKDDSPVQLTLADQGDIEPLKALYRIVVEDGTSYPHDRLPDHDEFMEYWFCRKTRWRIMCRIESGRRVAKTKGSDLVRPLKFTLWGAPTRAREPAAVSDQSRSESGSL